VPAPAYASISTIGQHPRRAGIELVSTDQPGQHDRWLRGV